MTCGRCVTLLWVCYMWGQMKHISKKSFNCRTSPESSSAIDVFETVGSVRGSVMLQMADGSFSHLNDFLGCIKIFPTQQHHVWTSWSHSSVTKSTLSVYLLATYSAIILGSFYLPLRPLFPSFFLSDFFPPHLTQQTLEYRLPLTATSPCVYVCVPQGSLCMSISVHSTIQDKSHSAVTAAKSAPATLPQLHSGTS